jgi:putative membrane protein
MKTRIFISTAFICLIALACNNSTYDNNKRDTGDTRKGDTYLENKGDGDFVNEAAMGSMMEVELGNVAISNASSQRVKDFGQQMVTDHTKAGQELKNLVAGQNMAVPTALDDDKQKKINDMKQKTGNDFDKDYMDMMVNDHKKDVDKFRKESTDGNDSTIKVWAGNTLPTLEHHLQMAESIQSELKNSK